MIYKSKHDVIANLVISNYFAWLFTSIAALQTVKIVYDIVDLK